MELFARIVKLGSLTLWPAILTLGAAIGAASTGCIIVDDDDDDWDHQYEKDDGDVYTPPPPDEPTLATIDTGASIEAVPGGGVGMFIEYAEGGHWTIWTTCDTTTSSMTCPFEAVVTVDTGSEILDASGEEGSLEGKDRVITIDSATVQFIAESGDDTDIVHIDTTPGAVVRLEMALNGNSEPRFVYWVGEGVLHEGAPTNPIDLQPSAP